jgi:archaellin
MDLSEWTVQYVSDDWLANLTAPTVYGSRAGSDTDPSVVKPQAHAADDQRFGVDVVTAESEDDLEITARSDRYTLVIDTSGEADPDNGGEFLGPLSPGTSVEVSITTGGGSQTVATLSVPETLAAKDPGDAVSV